MRSPWAVVPLRLVVRYGFLAHGAAKWSRGPAGFARLPRYARFEAPTARARCR